MIFNTFVFMQIFNEINSRKLGEKEYNVFKGFFNNMLFLYIVLATIAIQYCMVQFGGLALRTVPLTIPQHLFCLGIGMFTLIQGVIVKAVLPARLFGNISIKEEPMTEVEKSHSVMTMTRKATSFRKSMVGSKRVEDSHTVHTAIN